MIGTLITSILQAIAATAPGLLTAIGQSGAQSDEEAIAAARAHAEALPVRTGEGGAWEADLAARIEGGERPEPPANPFEGDGS